MRSADDGGVFFATDALVGARNRCWLVGGVFARGTVGESAAFSSVTEPVAGKRLQRVRGR